MNSTTASESLPVNAGFGFLPEYGPDSLTPAEWDGWRAPVLSLVDFAGPANKMVATIWAGALCETIALVGPEPGTELAVVLDDSNIELVIHERRRRGMSEGYAKEGRVALTRLQAVARGFAPVTRTSPAVGSGWAPHSEGIAALESLAASDDPSVASGAKALLSGLLEIPSGDWPNPLDDKTFQQFKAKARKSGVTVRLGWPALRSERVRREFMVARPAMELFRLRSYAASHWDNLAGALGPDVPDVGVLARGPVTLDAPSPWMIRDVTVNQPRSPQRAAAGKTASKAAARRLARAAVAAAAAEPEPLPAELEDILASWSPRDIPAAEWLAGREMTHEVMRRSHIRGATSFRKHLHLVARLVCWAVCNGYPERVDAILTAAAIDDHLRSAWAGAPDSTVSTARSHLRRIAAIVNPEHGGPVAPMPIAHTDVKPPYLDEDLYWFEKRITNLANPTLRRAISTAYALGIGAGLNSGDLREMTRAHIEDRGGDGILISVPGRRPRQVWLRRRYEQLLREGIKNLTSHEPVLGRRPHKDTVRDIYDAIQPKGAGARVLQGRLRNTWIATMMCEPIPVAVLLQAAGLEGARTLTDIAAYIHPTAEADIVRGAA